MKAKLIFAILVVFVTWVLFASVRGIPGNVSESNFNSPAWINGPFELSVERGRFALTYSLAENHSVSFTLPAAKFAVPDLGRKNGRYVSLFAPGVSFLATPGYLLGKLVGLSQVGTYLSVSFFALLNFLLIRSIAQKLGANSSAATLGALSFLFASPAFAYSTTLYQHHISTFLVLSGIYLAIGPASLVSLAGIWFVYALSISVDYPNLFLMLPVGLFALTHIINFKTAKNKLSINFKGLKTLSFLAAVIPLSFLLWFNWVSNGSPFQLSGTVAQVKEIGTDGLPVSSFATPEELNKSQALDENRGLVGAFGSREMLNGLFILLISPDRGVIVYGTVILFGIVGIIIAGKQKTLGFSMLLGTILVNLLVYSMWGDPWGGWAFGSRYLIPAYSVMAIFISLGLSSKKKSLLLHFLFLLAFAYSLLVNTLGAITSNANPPRIEVLELEKVSGKEQKYTFMRNLQHLVENGSKSYLFLSYFHRYMSGIQYLLLLDIPILLLATSLLAINTRKT